MFSFKRPISERRLKNRTLFCLIFATLSVFQWPSLVESSCSLPANKSDLIAFYQATSENVQPNEIVPDSAVLEFNCTSGSSLVGEKSTYCSGNSWAHTIPRCLRFCSKQDVTESVSTVAICEYNNAVVKCDDRIRPGTRAKIKCVEGYNLPSAPVKDVLVCGEDGQWDSPKFNCVQKCGEVFDSIVPFLSGGFTTNITEVPWQVAIYDIFNEINYRHICSGSIITPKLLLTAAHCFWDEANFKSYKPEYYTIVAGKYYTDYNAQEDVVVQRRNVSEIIIHGNFTGRDTLYKSDIAIAVLNQELRYAVHVMPICIEFPNSNDKTVHSDILGRFAGWGATETGRANELRSIQLRTVSYQKCRDQLLPAATKYRLTEDKFCIFDEYGASLCAGDSGGAFAQPQRIPGSDKIRYHLLGILSNAPNPTSTCSVQSLTAMTNIYFYRKFILDSVNQYKQPLASSVHGCAIPDSDDNLIVNYLSNNNKYQAFGIAPDSGVVQFTCRRGYTLVGVNAVRCSRGSWENPIPDCIRFCSKHAVANSLSSMATCEYNNVPVECGDRILPFTRAKINCTDGFDPPDTKVDDILICGEDGEWSNPKFDCVLQCGKIPDFRSARNYTGVPWQVAIYDISDSANQKHICSGSIISPRVVISAAYCFLDPPTMRSYNKNSFTIIAGKQFSSYSAMESHPVQQAAISDIVLHPDYKGRETYYKNNIAVLVLEKSFTFGEGIAPICLRFRDDNNAAIPSDILGRFPGWGVSEMRLSAKELLTTQVSTLSYEKCLAQIPEWPRRFLTDDKFCFFEYDGCNLYDGDGGAGFAQPQRIPGSEKPKYYLLGVLSFQFNSNVHCIKTLTNINYFQNFITNAMKPSIEMRIN